MQNNRVVYMDEILKEIFIEVFSLPHTDLPEQLTRELIDQWDSMKQLSLVSAIESEFDIVLELEDATSIDSLLSARAVLQKYL